MTTTPYTGERTDMLVARIEPWLKSAVADSARNLGITTGEYVRRVLAQAARQQAGEK